MKSNPDCTLCKLHKTTDNVCILGDGPRKSGVMVIGEAPGREEEAQGRVFVGKTGKHLMSMLEDTGFDVDEIFFTNAIACRPPNNKTPTKSQINSCKKWLDYQISIVKPKFVLLLGNTPLQAITGKTGIKKRRGKPFVKDDIIFLPAYHPSALFYSPELTDMFMRDLKVFHDIVTNGEIPREKELDYIIVKNQTQVKEMLSCLTGTISLDIETTNLYPWLDESVINTIGFGCKNKQFILPVHHPESPWSEQGLEDILDCIEEKLQDCYLVAHNGKFDFLYIWVILGREWYKFFDFDTMLAHYLHDENGFHGLKLLAQQYYGAPDWEIDKEEKTGGSLDKIALYHAHDLFYTRKLRFTLGNLLNEDPAIKRVFQEIMMPCARLFVEVEYDGMVIDKDKMDDAEKFLRNQVAEAEADLKKHGNIENWGSTKQLAKLLFVDLKIPVVDKTKTGAASTSESVLKRIDHPIAGALLKRREAMQQLSFFIEGWKPYLVKARVSGKHAYFLHPSFKLHGTVTGRLSCENPNCIDGDSLIEIPGGQKKLRDMEIGDLVYSYDKNKKLAINKVTGIKNNGFKKAIKLYLHSSRKKVELILTGDHLVRLTSGEYKRADQLARGDHVMALKRRDCNNGYPELKIFDYKGPGFHHGWVDEHRVMFKLLHGHLPEDVHHIDGDRSNNHPRNLQGLSRSAHMSLTVKGDEGRRRALLAHRRHGTKIVNATIKARKERAERECPTNKVIKAWKLFSSKPHAVKLAASWLGVTRKTVERRWTLLGYASYAIRNNHRIYKVEELSTPVEVWDISVEKDHNFIANEVCVHNCQQIPRDPRIRSLIFALPDEELVECDLSQIELRIAAELSQETGMLEAFANDKDVHWKTCMDEIARAGAEKELVLDTARTANQNRKLTYAEALEVVREMGPDAASEIRPEWKEFRKKAKAINFGYLYGMWWKKFKLYARDNYGVTVTDDEAQDSRESFFESYRDLPEWHNRQKRFARRNGYVRSLSGRKRRLPKALMSEDCPERREAERQAINSPVQSFANEINLMAAIQLRKEFPRSVVKICGTIHDAILARVQKKDVVRVTKRLLEIMSNPELFETFDIQLGVPILAEEKIGPWSLGVSLKKWMKANGIRG